MKIATVIALTLIATSCTPHLRDGLRVSERDFQRQEPIITRRAAFELQCPAKQLRVTALNLDGYRRMNQAGVAGCGRRVIYVRADGQWILNSAVSDKRLVPR